MSTPPGNSTADERKISFNLRRTRLRFTAFPTFFETERPNLGLPAAFGRAWTEKNLPLQTEPSR